MVREDPGTNNRQITLNGLANWLPSRTERADEAHMLVNLCLSTPQLQQSASPSAVRYFYFQAAALRDESIFELSVMVPHFSCKSTTKKSLVVTSCKCKLSIHIRLITPLYFEPPCMSRQVSWMLSMAPDNQASWRFNRMLQRTTTLSSTIRTHEAVEFVKLNRLRWWTRARPRNLPPRS